MPKTDGTFGFLYRTEDGIAHAAKGDSNGVIQGTFSYTDPTGLKVNYNYNAGSKFTPGYNYEAGPNIPYDDGQYREEYQREDYHQQYRQQTEAPQPQPQRQNRPQLQPEVESNYAPRSRPRYHSQYREPIEEHQQRRTRPSSSRYNEVYDDFN